MALAFIFPFKGSGQGFYGQIFLGMSNYTGEIQDKRFTFQQSNTSYGLGLIKSLHPNFHVRFDVHYGKLSAHDKYGVNPKRNLSFYTHIYEASAGLEYHLFKLTRYKLTPYLYAAAAVYNFSPYTKNIDGNKVSLAELNTEGQGLYPEKPEYTLTQFSIPLGGGIIWAINNKYQLGFVIALRKTFTDYLDDVSTTYADQNKLLLYSGQRAVDIAYRGDELPNGPLYPLEGTQRGNPRTKDWYYMAGLTFRIEINPKGRTFKNNSRTQMLCPTVY